MIVLFQIEEPGHMNGRPPPKPWAAEITGTCPQFGLARTFVRALRDFRGAHRAWSGNVYGVIATFPLHEGRLYEIGQCKGKPSKRRFVREFFFVEGGKLDPRSPAEALVYAAERSSAA